MMSRVINDPLGSPLILMDEDGNIVKRYRFDPWGNIEAQWGTEPNHYLFTGKEKDRSGFYYFGARYYNPRLGRWITPDIYLGQPDNLELKDPQTMNPYVYCTNNPLRYIDPNGEWRTYIETNLFSQNYGTVYVYTIGVSGAIGESIISFLPGGSLFSTAHRSQMGDITVSRSDWLWSLAGIASGMAGFGSNTMLQVASKIIGGATTGRTALGVVQVAQEVALDPYILGIFNIVTGIPAEPDGFKMRLGNILREKGKVVENIEYLKEIEKFVKLMIKLGYDFSKLSPEQQSEYREYYEAWQKVVEMYGYP